MAAQNDDFAQLKIRSGTFSPCSQSMCITRDRVVGIDDCCSFLLASILNYLSCCLEMGIFD